MKVSSILLSLFQKFLINEGLHISQATSFARRELSVSGGMFLVEQKHNIPPKIRMRLQPWRHTPLPALQQSNPKRNFQTPKSRQIGFIARNHTTSLINLQHRFIDNSSQRIESGRVAIGAPVQQACDAQLTICR